MVSIFKIMKLDETKLADYLGAHNHFLVLYNNKEYEIYSGKSRDEVINDVTASWRHFDYERGGVTIYEVNSSNVCFLEKETNITYRRK